MPYSQSTGLRVGGGRKYVGVRALGEKCVGVRAPAPAESDLIHLIVE